MPSTVILALYHACQDVSSIEQETRGLFRVNNRTESSELENAEFRGDVERWFPSQSGLPRKIAAVRVFAHAAIEVAAPLVAMLWCFAQRFPRNLDGRHNFAGIDPYR